MKFKPILCSLYLIAGTENAPLRSSHLNRFTRSTNLTGWKWFKVISQSNLVFFVFFSTNHFERSGVHGQAFAAFEVSPHWLTLKGVLFLIPETFYSLHLVTLLKLLASCMTHAESGDGKTKSDDGICSDYSLLVLSHKTVYYLLLCRERKKKNKPMAVS